MSIRDKRAEAAADERRRGCGGESGTVLGKLSRIKNGPVVGRGYNWIISGGGGGVLPS
jgi:hypothetical protein